MTAKSTFRILQKAGGLRSGSDSRGGIWHAVPPENAYDGRALCGQMPRIQWSSWDDGPEVTCPKCRKLIQESKLKRTVSRFSVWQPRSKSQGSFGCSSEISGHREKG